ncbi:transcriptional corepressor LEUNIG-like isoform X2 [Actinidia eriantha]|uniref:transcriptional corepressor LEUNIG-like isoform X2 n=1 Tax=Actinidia eriantha TaxID=165200 RepID=UPI0025890F26|nr:transcriptional corepressor LEUNIG-like isoform X2 [Actinidia eriantha]
MGNQWDNRAMFERYLYDYLIKKGMYETAEIFRREANLTFNPMSLPAIDVPDGFLHEWWLIFYDMFKASEPKNPDNDEASSNVVEQMVNVSQRGNPSLLREQELNEQMIKDLTDGSDFACATGDNLMPFMRCQLVKTELTSQGSASSQPQQKSLELSKKFYYPGGSSCGATMETEKVEPNESERKGKNPACSKNGSNTVQVATDCPSEISSPICKSFDDLVKLSDLHADDNKDEGKTYSSNSGKKYATSDANTSKGSFGLHDAPNG